MTWSRVPATANVDIRAVSALVDHLDDTHFDVALLAMLGQSGVDVQEACGIGMAGAGRPEAVGWCGKRADAGIRSLAMAQRFFHCDPRFRTLPERAAIGESFVSTLRPGKVENDEYRWLCFDEPGYRQRITIARAETGGWGFFSLFHDQEAVSDSQVMHLAALSALAYPFIRRHSGWQNGGADAPPVKDKANRLADLLGSRYPSLTQRERHVCAMTVMGNDSSTIAHRLAITRNTVLTYRRRAYERLGVSSASALLVELV